jgi:serine protease Do
MKFESIAMTMALGVAGYTSTALCQEAVLGQALPGLQGETIYLVQQAPPAPPTPPVPPAPALAPMPPMQGVLRLMATNGSYLGVGVRDVDAERKKALNLKEERGAEITSVQEDTPASKAGLKTGDVVLEYAGQRVESMEQFIRLVRETPAGREVKLVVVRNGAQVNLTARPENGRNRLESGIRLMSPMPAISIREFGRTMDTPRAAMYWKSGTLGVEVEALDRQLAEFFGVKEGVLVRSVAKGSSAEKSGIKTGDVIVKVEETKVTTPREVTAAIQAARSGNDKAIVIGLVREKKDSQVKVTFEEEGQAPAAPRGRSVKNFQFE